MDPLIGLGTGLVSSAGGLLGGIMNNRSNQTSQMYANQANYWMQLQNQQWQEHMSSTAYQRATKDMKAAGLNPAMMYGGSGGAASTPSGGAATAQAQKNENVLGPATERLMLALRLNNETALNNAVVEKNVQEAATSAKQAANIQSDTDLKNIAKIYAAPEAAARVLATRNTAFRTDAEKRNIEASIPGTIAASDKKKDEAIDYHNYGPNGGIAATAARLGGTAGALAGVGMNGFITQNSGKALEDLNSILFGAPYDTRFRGRLAPMH